MSSGEDGQPEEAPKPPIDAKRRVRMHLEAILKTCAEENWAVIVMLDDGNEMGPISSMGGEPDRLTELAHFTVTGMPILLPQALTSIVDIPRDPKRRQILGPDGKVV